MKKDDLTPEHLEWLVESRSRNQRSCLELFRIFEEYPTKVKSKEFRAHSQSLVSVGFSLWRAAFLADRTGQREAVFSDARAFLGQMITNNAINYPQDRASREWTFNYYMKAAAIALVDLSKRWSDVGKVLSKYERVRKGTTNPRRRWNRHQNAFEAALNCYRSDLGK